MWMSHPYLSVRKAAFSMLENEGSGGRHFPKPVPQILIGLFSYGGSSEGQVSMLGSTKSNSFVY